MSDFYIILRKHKMEEHSHKEERKEPVPKITEKDLASTSRGLENYAYTASDEQCEGYMKYTDKYGNHFNDKLAMWASRRMRNSVFAEPEHHWDIEDVRRAFSNLGLIKPVTNTWGDATYAANMAYADYYGNSIKTETECLRQAQADLADPDGYPCKVFNRFMADIAGMDIQVPWEEII